MNDVKDICIHVSSFNGECLLEETHLIARGPGGLLRVPDRLGLAADNLLCFPSKEEMAEISNKGAPFSALCNIMNLGCVPSLSSMLRGAGYEISAESVAIAWVRADKAQGKTSGGSCANPALDAQTCSSEGSRHHLSPKVRYRMVMLCNEVCPRDADNIMLVDRSLGDERRPSWCIAKIMHDLEREFDVSELRGVKEKVITYISRTAGLFKRLQNITEEEWSSMSQSSRDKKRKVMNDLEDAAETWRRGPYGHFWIKEGMKRQPTTDEINIHRQPKMVEDISPGPPTQ